MFGLLLLLSYAVRRVLGVRAAPVLESALEGS